MDEPKLSKDEIREKLGELAEGQSVQSLMAAVSDPLVGALVQLRQAQHAVNDEERLPETHALGTEIERTTSQASLEMAKQDLEDYLVELLHMQQYCQCQHCRMSQAEMN